MEKIVFVPGTIPTVESIAEAFITDPSTASAEVLDTWNGLWDEKNALIEAKASADAKIIALEEYIKNLEDELIKAAGKEAAEAEAITGVSSETFEHDGKEYGFNYPAVLFNGEKITADHVLADPAIQAELVEMGSGFISELE